MNTKILAIIGLAAAVSMSTVAEAQTADDAAPQTKSKTTAKTPAYRMVEVTGTIVDAATGNPLAGVQVQTLGDRRFTAMTEEDGTFKMQVPDFATALYVFTADYASLQVPIGRDRKVSVRMLSDKFKPMYDKGTTITAQSKLQDRSANAMTIESEIADQLSADVHTISRSGAPGIGSAMFIRGLNSLNANAQPLIVVDGVPQDMQYSRTGLHMGDFNNQLLNFNPADIEDVTVLKNGTAIYGSKGANGVIVINTKRGHSLATRIEANVGMGVSLVPRLPEMMNADEYRNYATELLGGVDYKLNDYTKIPFNFLNDDPNGYYYQMYHNDTDWSKEVYHTAITQNYNLNVQGGDNVGMYNLSLGYTDGQSTARKNGFNRLNIRFNSDFSITKKLTTQFDMDYVKLTRDVFDDGASSDFTQGTVTSPTFLGLIKSPFLNPYSYNNMTGKFSETLSDADDYLNKLGSNFSLANPTAILTNGNGKNKNRVENTLFHARIAPSYQFFDGFTLTENINYTLNRNSQRYYRPVGGVPTFYIDGLGLVQSQSASLFAKEETIMSDTRLRFTRQLGAHGLDVFGGFRYLGYSFEANQPSGQYQSGGNDKTPNISSGMTFTDATGEDDSWRTLTWYAQADYNYRNRYFLEVALAMESNSRFGNDATSLKIGGVSWGLFPSVQAGWVLTNESWFPTNIGIDYLRVNAGYDISGNDDISNYAARTSFEVMKFLNTSVPAVQLNNIGNENITYERTGRLNIGFDTRMLHNRLAVSANFYFNHTSNLLTLKNFTSPVAGVKSYWSNGGSLENRGFEINVSGKPVVARKFTLELGASLGHYNNEIKSLPNDTRLSVNGVKGAAQGFTSSIYGTDNVATMVGYSAGVFYGYKTNGVFATDAEAKAAGNGDYLYLLDGTGQKQQFKAGDVHFVDLNGDGCIDENDKTVIGNPNPDIYGNLFATVNWGNFRLSAIFGYSLGNDVYNYQRSVLESGSRFFNQTTAVAGRWRVEGQQTDVPRATYGDPMGNSRFSDRWIEDGSYLRLRSLNLTYKIPVNLSWLQGLQVWAEANNLFTITKYLGGDPEFATSNSVLYQGIDTGCISLGRSFSLGLKINL